MQLFLSLCFLLLVAGCGVKQPVKRDFVVEHQQEIIAKFADLPDAPFQSQLKAVAVDMDNHEQLQLFYITSLPMHDVMIFYEQQMERLGWQLFAQSVTQDYLLHYSKPVQFCSILIQNGQFTLYVCNKKGA